tara:strand:- start:19 stop:279 length:261 start_codon:yes stop_codon:yes gene_type:complete
MYQGNSFVFTFIDDELMIFPHKKGYHEVCHSTNIFDMMAPYVDYYKKANARLSISYECPKGLNRWTVLAGELHPELKEVEIYSILI